VTTPLRLELAILAMTGRSPPTGPWRGQAVAEWSQLMRPRSELLQSTWCQPVHPVPSSARGEIRTLTERELPRGLSLRPAVTAGVAEAEQVSFWRCSRGVDGGLRDVWCRPFREVPDSSRLFPRLLGRQGDHGPWRRRAGTAQIAKGKLLSVLRLSRWVRTGHGLDLAEVVRASIERDWVMDTPLQDRDLLCTFHDSSLVLATPHGSRSSSGPLHGRHGLSDN